MLRLLLVSLMFCLLEQIWNIFGTNMGLFEVYSIV